MKVPLRRVASIFKATFLFNSLFHIIVLILIGLALYLNTFNNSFVWDDEYLIERNSHIRSWRNVPEIFISSLSLPSPKQGNFYRPFQTISFLFDYSFWKLNPVGYHVTNLLFHILNALLLYFLTRMLLQNQLTSLVAATLFLVHPVHVEAVTYVSGRADPIVASFCLISLILFLKNFKIVGAAFMTPVVAGRINPTPTRWIFYLGSIISFLCALLSKEAALIFPFLLVWCGYSLMSPIVEGLINQTPTSCRRRQPNLISRYYLPFFLLAALYVIMRLTLLKAISETHPPMAPFYPRVITFFNVILRYMGLLFFPQNLHMERRFPFLNSLFQPEAIFSIVLVVLLILIIIWLRKYSKEASFGLGWFLIALLPVSNIMPINAAMAEHWLYMPSIGFFLAVAIGISSLKKAKALRYILLAIILISCSVKTIRQNLVWNDEISLFNHILKFTPDSARIYINLGVAYAKRDEYDKAIKEYKKAIELYPDFEMTYINMGYMYSKKGMNEEAARAYKAALRLRPYLAKYILDELRLIFSNEEADKMVSHPYSGPSISKLELADLYNNVALIYDKQDRFSDAVRMYEKSIETNPEYIDAHVNLGILYRKKEIYDNAVYEFNELLKIDRDSMDGHFNLGFIYDRLGRYEEALSEYREVVKINPRDVKAHNNLGTAYGKLGMHLEAISEYKKALSINPDFAQSYFNLGSAYANRGEMDKAIAEWEKALQLDPDLEAAKISLEKAKK